MPRSVAEFAQANGLSLLGELAPSNPRLILPSRLEGHPFVHFKVVLRRRRSTRSTFTVYFSRRGANNRLPEVAEVLDALAVDAHLSLSPPTPEELAVELELSVEQARKYLDICNKRAAGLKRVLGAGLFSELIFETKRLPVET